MKYIKKVMHASLTCRQVEEFLMDYLESRLGFWMTLQFRLHLFMCPNCSKYFQEYKNTIALEKRIFENPEDEAIGNVPDDILQAILNVKGSSN
ncbi:MAG: hypothetical protein DHS20C09_06410 [marine bacterium B5-7]|nr:MAG: hypothetical protein DHS20C09_06410 [marine bacterium B5-7]